MQRKPEGVETIAQRSLSPTAQNCLMSPSEGNGSAVQSFPARRQSAFTMFPPATLELKTHGVPSVPTERMSGNALSGRSTCDQTPLVQFTTTLLPVSAIAHRLSFVPRGAVVRAGAPVTNSQLPSEVYSYKLFAESMAQTVSSRPAERSATTAFPGSGKGTWLQRFPV